MTPEQEERKIREIKIDILLTLIALITWCYLLIHLMRWLFDL
jgi:hypothetical protein